MLSSFILVDKPSRCSDCQIKTELRVTENVKIERSQEIDAEVQQPGIFCCDRWGAFREQDT